MLKLIGLAMVSLCANQSEPRKLLQPQHEQYPPKRLLIRDANRKTAKHFFITCGKFTQTGHFWQFWRFHWKPNCSQQEPFFEGRFGVDSLHFKHGHVFICQSNGNTLNDIFVSLTTRSAFLVLVVPCAEPACCHRFGQPIRGSSSKRWVGRPEMYYMFTM